ncbi:MAG: hypothetical protein IJ146_08355 [Kiritimatiellae bacterium]|jgi:cell division protein FtsL|nr:hypothetical protein [Kiritimatiellia bacterium]
MNKYLANSCKILFVVAFVTIVAATVVIAYPKYRHARDLMMEKERIMRRIDEKRAEIAEIKTKQNRFNTDREFVETLARQNRRVFPGELVFVFDD